MKDKKKKIKKTDQMPVFVYFSFAETVVLIDFIILAVLWISRKPGFMPGWGELFPEGYVQTFSDHSGRLFNGIHQFILK